MFTADQIVAHLIGDYIIQSDWMAEHKTKNSVAAAIHALTYTLPFLLITLDPAALAVICLTHFAIDRWRLARYLVWLKNGARGPITSTGFSEKKPVWMAVWLLIFVDNIIHIVINGIAIGWVAQ